MYQRAFVRKKLVDGSDWYIRALRNSTHFQTIASVIRDHLFGCFEDLLDPRFAAGLHGRFPYFDRRFHDDEHPAKNPND
ncbi:hypothetical protein [uncultured Tateyamaria sp.]|uniref:hypothetical protein n=1 Tax=uncultured Tateyamaria sp. TaxID=455651 RepID=UPI00260D6ACD|nr:hypothetical protein [uncultured Tateyamaria sp.]